MASNAPPHGCLILDACCIINLYASGHIEEILGSIGQPVAVAAYVITEEVLKIYNGPEEDERQTTEQIDLQPLIERGLLTIVSFNSQVEENTFVYLASKLDDGEAATSAAAIHRGWTIVTDDKKAISVLNKEFPQVPLLSTLEIVKLWVDSTQPDSDIVRAALKNIRIRANYEPNPMHDLYDWWLEKRNK